MIYGCEYDKPDGESVRIDYTTNSGLRKHYYIPIDCIDGVKYIHSVSGISPKYNKDTKQIEVCEE